MPQITDANRKWWILVTMTGALSMILIDETVVGVSLPTIQRDLGMSSTGVQWIVNAYLLTLAAFVAVGGRLADMFGGKNIFRLGALIFIIFSGLSGLAQSEAWIIGARAMQGIGAALMIPPSGAMVMNAFPPEERGRAMGIYAGISMVFLALGPLLGGFLTEEVTWRAVFYINLPIGIAMLALAHLSLPADEPEGAKMDWEGLFTLVPGLAALVLALMQSQTWGWGSPATIGLLVLAAVLLPAFILLELRSDAPLVQLKLFKSHNFSADNGILAMVQFGLTGLTVFGAIWVQTILGFTPIEAGLSLLPVMIPLLILAPRTGALYDRIGPRALVAGGAILIALGFFWVALVLDKVSYPWLLPGYLALGIGLASVMTPASTDCMNAAAAELRSQASGVMQTMRQVGGTIGLAVMGTVVTQVESSSLTSSSVATLGPVQAHNHAFTDGVSAAYYVSGSCLLIAAVIGALVLRHVRAADDPEQGKALPVPTAHHAHASARA